VADAHSKPVWFITGCSTGFGRELSVILLKRGCRVVVTARDKAKVEDIVAGHNKNGLALALDVDQQDQIDAAVKATEAQFGRIDVLVNNAALRREKPFAEMDYAEWRAILDVTLDGAFHCTKACLPALCASGAGTIVNIGGLSAHTGAASRAHVVTAKAGIVGFTRALAHDLAGGGITVNCVVPGLIGTPRPKDRPEPAHHLVHNTITGERGRPEDVAAVVRFLCTPAARYITGQAIHANGGAYLGV
jgi:3-oxoacyl-[acyl-carrier protein] reductase